MWLALQGMPLPAAACRALPAACRAAPMPHLAPTSATWPLNPAQSINPQESIVTNLASQYELQSTAASLATKRRMGDWVAAAAPDDFALASTKTGALA